MFSRIDKNFFPFKKLLFRKKNSGIWFIIFLRSIIIFLICKEGVQWVQGIYLKTLSCANPYIPS